ncbi:VOC family protein [Paenibacillus melissococcoides]|uniref:VOC family protein n=1 Tax=Paenibacillus melissococcoides TaxID=2912268 RepID=A0ABN8UAN7_9BACL|nr:MULTISPECIES: VOC family protein [Paenibacillus]MEB9896437.1 VOC family protein [Bacillus cereus]CAH8248221.1 VOC family protein [Paenibacillus melissococcoides]CAH8718122.1 VOC family protein [Paenibacillus melissococcoides]CAH8719000.1 VOC family protein [Paenibacillus melissococcoides]GIO81964.1 VOC family protein [Paenibacillus dendritiformis]
MSATLEVAIFLSMNGRAKEAVDFYKKHFNAEELLLVTYEDMAKRDSSLQLTDENKNNIAHSVLSIGNTKVMLAEDTMDVKEKYAVGNNISLCIQSADLEEVESFYKSLTTDDRVRIIFPLSANVFSEAYGIIEDPFGIQIQLMFDDRLQ